MVSWREDGNYPIKDIVERSTQFIQLADDLAEFLDQNTPSNHDPHGRMLGASGRRDLAVFAAWAIILRINDGRSRRDHRRNECHRF